MKKIVFMITLFVHCALCNAQTGSDTRTVVGVSEFTCETDSKYAKLVTEKVVEMLTNAKRFRVVDRTSHDKIKAELELQKTEAFFDSKNLVEQDVAIAAEKMITGHINKIPVYSIKNTDGSVRGYKGSVSFQMKIVDVATGESTEATSFEGKASELMLSPESAVTQAMQSLQSRSGFRRKCLLQGQQCRCRDSGVHRHSIPWSPFPLWCRSHPAYRPGFGTPDPVRLQNGQPQRSAPQNRLQL